MVEYLYFILELWLCLDAVVPEKEEDKSKQATRAMMMLFILLFCWYKYIYFNLYKIKKHYYNK